MEQLFEFNLPTNVPHGESRHTVTRNKHIKLYSENRFLLSTGDRQPVVSYYRVSRLTVGHVILEFSSGIGNQVILKIYVLVL